MVITSQFEVATHGNSHCLNLTPQVVALVAQTSQKDGLVTIFLPATTAALTIQEFEPGLVADLSAHLERLLPQAAPYQHNVTEGDENGHSHLRASLLSPSLTIPLVAGQLALGQWQQILLLDFDVRPRVRQVVVQMLGE